MSKSLRLQVLRTACYLYLIAITGFWFWDSYAGSYWNWYALSIGIMLLAGLALNKTWMDMTVGVIVSFHAFWMTLAVTSDLFDHLDHSKPVRRPWQYFGWGYGIFALALLASGLISIQYFLRKNLKVNVLQYPP